MAIGELSNALNKPIPSQPEKDVINKMEEDSSLWNKGLEIFQKCVEAIQEEPKLKLLANEQ